MIGGLKLAKACEQVPSEGGRGVATTTRLSLRKDENSTYLGGHDSIAPGEVEALLDILVVEDVAVREDGDLDGRLHRPDLLPVSETLS